MITSATRRQVTSRRARQTFTKLQSLQDEVLALKRQVAQMEQLMNAELVKAQSATGSASYAGPQSLAELKPRRQPPPGKTAMEAIQGRWPGDETTHELLAQLKGLD